MIVVQVLNHDIANIIIIITITINLVFSRSVFTQ